MWGNTIDFKRNMDVASVTSPIGCGLSFWNLVLGNLGFLQPNVIFDERVELGCKPVSFTVAINRRVNADLRVLPPFICMYGSTENLQTLL